MEEAYRYTIYTNIDHSYDLEDHYFIPNRKIIIVIIAPSGNFKQKFRIINSDAPCNEVHHMGSKQFDIDLKCSILAEKTEIETNFIEKIIKYCELEKEMNTLSKDLLQQTPKYSLIVTDDRTNEKEDLAMCISKIHTDVDAAIDGLKTSYRKYLNHNSMFYLGCCYAIKGHTDLALEHLKYVACSSVDWLPFVLNNDLKVLHTNSDFKKLLKTMYDYSKKIFTFQDVKYYNQFNSFDIIEKPITREIFDEASKIVKSILESQ